MYSTLLVVRRLIKSNQNIHNIPKVHTESLMVLRAQIYRMSENGATNTYSESTAKVSETSCSNT